jgi:hypothetical protein
MVETGLPALSVARCCILLRQDVWQHRATNARLSGAPFAQMSPFNSLISFNNMSNPLQITPNSIACWFICFLLLSSYRCEAKLRRGIISDLPRVIDWARTIWPLQTTLSAGDTGPNAIAAMPKQTFSPFAITQRCGP